jgi:hypothetical protein
MNPLQLQAMRTAVICCAVLEEEVRHFARSQPQIVAMRILPQGLHNTPSLLRQELQQAINDLERSTDVSTIALVYGLCSRGTEEISSSRACLVIPRAHDCITLLLGSRHRYASYVREHPGTYWYSPGWNRHHLPPGPLRYDKYLAEYREKFSEEDAQFLMQTEQAWFSSYDRATYVDLGVSDTAADLTFTQDCADWLGWTFDRQHGEAQLLEDLLSGPWDDERFLVLEPGQTLRMTADERVIESVPMHVNGKRLELSR